MLNDPALSTERGMGVNIPTVPAYFVDPNAYMFRNRHRNLWSGLCGCSRWLNCGIETLVTLWAIWTNSHISNAFNTHSIMQCWCLYRILKRNWMSKWYRTDLYWFRAYLHSLCWSTSDTYWAYNNYTVVTCILNPNWCPYPSNCKVNYRNMISLSTQSMSQTHQFNDLLHC